MELTWWIGDGVLPERGPAAFALLLPAFTAADDSRAIDDLLRWAVDAGCTEVCLVGPLADRLHDVADDVLERRGQLDVLTTSLASCVEGWQWLCGARLLGTSSLVAARSAVG